MHDPRETALPNAGLLTLEDAETGELIELDTSRRKVRARFAELAEARMDETAMTLRRAGVDVLSVRTDDDPVAALAAFFRRRERRVA